MTMSSEQTIQDAYIAYYGRPADPSGLAYWASRLDNADGNLDAIIDAFGTSAEFTDRFGDLDTPDLINAVYQRLFKRDADEGGLAFYTDQLDSGQRSLGTIALDILNGSRAYDLTLLNEKRDVAEAFTQVVALGELPYEGERGIAVGTRIMGVIGSDWTEYWRDFADFFGPDEYIKPLYMANQFASQLDGDPTFIDIDRYSDVGGTGKNALYLPWAGELMIEGIHDARLSPEPDGAEYDTDRYWIADLSAGSYDIELVVDGGNRDSTWRILAYLIDNNQFSENILRIGYDPSNVDSTNFHQQLRFEDDLTLNVIIRGPSDESTYILSITPSDTDYPVWEPDWQYTSANNPELISGFYDYLFI